MFSRSPTVAFAGATSVDFSAGTDSPVSAASSVRRFLASIRRKSAGILSPDSSRTMSPGVRSSAGMSRVSPSRTARASAESMLRIEFERLLGAALLQEPEKRIENHDREDDRGVQPQAQHQLDEAGGEQDIDEDVVELGEEPHQRPLLLALRQAVRPVSPSDVRRLPRRPDLGSDRPGASVSTSSADMACQGAGADREIRCLRYAHLQSSLALSVATRPLVRVITLIRGAARPQL